ncbi:phage protein Gp27 family protein [Sphingobium sp.]|uniref:phage protein Gp27 family protein n=1 Tax=Sphingobium sp. TaxID=1912891 RepID=UPI00260F6199|nr:phage protein Gp27 family protein [Sphingobium sp.]
MGRKSSIKTLPPKVQAAVVQALEAHATIDEIVAKLDELGHSRSRSAVGRYAKDYAEMAKHQRDIRVVAEAFASEFGSADNAEGKFMVQMLTSIGARMILPMATDQDQEFSSLDFQRLAKATKDLLSSAKLDAERDAKIREEAAKEARERAAEVVERVARTGERGFSRDTVDAIKREILRVG